MKIVFYSDGRALHQALEQAFASTLEVVQSRELLDEALQAHQAGIVILDAQYGAKSGYAICEEIKEAYGEAWRVHLLSNEASVGEREKASYARVDQVFIVPEGITQIANL